MRAVIGLNATRLCSRLYQLEKQRVIYMVKKNISGKHFYSSRSLTYTLFKIMIEISDNTKLKIFQKRVSTISNERRDQNYSRTCVKGHLYKRPPLHNNHSQVRPSNIW